MYFVLVHKAPTKKFIGGFFVVGRFPWTGSVCRWVLWWWSSSQCLEIVFKFTQAFLLLLSFNGEPPQCPHVSDGIRGCVVLIFDEVGCQNHPCPPITSSAVYSYSSIVSNLLCNRVHYLGQKLHIGTGKVFDEKVFILHMIHMFEWWWSGVRREGYQEGDTFLFYKKKSKIKNFGVFR